MCCDFSEVTFVETGSYPGGIMFVLDIQNMLNVMQLS